MFTYSILNGEGEGEGDSENCKTLAVMWDVPFDYNIWKSNFWNVKIYEIKQQATVALFREMRYREGQPFRGADDYHNFEMDSFRGKGCMTSNSNSRLIIKLYDK